MPAPTPACQGKHELFDALLDHHPNTPTHAAARAEAAKVCAGCPMVACTHRVNGCGTNAGYSRHRRRGEAPCQPCRDAHAVKAGAARRARGYAA